MPLPDLIEIVPLDRPVRAEITVPGSKSITNRALVLAALASGEVTLEGALWSEDTQVMVEALQRLGFELRVEPDAAEPCNRTVTVRGLGGRIPRGGTAESPLELYVGNAGTAARFLTALVCLGEGVYRLQGTPRMHERPQAGLFSALRELGYRVESANDRLPAVIHGSGWRPGICRVDITESSQFASALLLCAHYGGWEVKVTGHNAEESPYVVLTERLLESFPRHSGRFEIEPDASSGAYFWAAGWLASLYDPRPMPEISFRQDSPVTVKRWPSSGWQIDADFPDFLPLPEQISREYQLGDSIMMAIVLAADAGAAGVTEPGEASATFRFTDLGRLRQQECERVVALRTELTKCGARVQEEGDTLLVRPAPLHGATIQTYNDHRIAMCFAILGLKVPGIRIQNPACVKKTFPNFFQKLAAPPPEGLGVTILDATTRRKLAVAELFADENASKSVET
jgi:3-phosphoshikimate 1-carboxyvinyltransferase